MKRRVVVTGLGVLTSNANGIASFAEALKQGRSGIGEISQFSTGQYACRIAGEIKSLPLEDEPADQLDRASRLALMGADLAMEDAGLDPATLGVGELGVVVGTTCGGVLSLEKVSEVLETGGDVSAIPDWRIAELSFFAATNHVARRVRATGPVLSATVACSSGTHAVGVGADLIRSGRAPLMLTGGVDVISRFIYRGFAALNGLGAPPYRAFDKNRNGVVLGEGAAFLVLEELEHAQARGAHIYAEILGHSFNNDGCHIVNPNPTGEGIARSFGMALRDAGLGPEAIQHINAHGTGTMANDSAETAGIKLAFGDRATHIPVTSIKPMLGHTSGAAGAVELAAAILSLKDGFIPATINFETQDPACDLNVIAAPVSTQLETVASANSGFGGSNAAVIVSRSAAPRHVASQEERVVISGVGALIPGVDSVDGLWQRLHGPAATLPADGFGVEIAPFDFFAMSGLAVSKDARRMDLFSQYAAMGGLRTIQDSGIDPVALDEQLGLVLGSAYACLESNEKFSSGLTKTKVNPVIYQNTVSNAVTGYMCMLLGLRGPVSVLNQGWLAGSAAIAYGYELVRNGRCRAVLAGGAERLCRMTGLVLDRAGMLSRERYGVPFDPEGRGVLPTEGAAFVVLESLSSARARGARIYGELSGYGIASAAGQRPEDAIARATGLALSSLPAARGELHIYSSGCGLPQLDRWEWEGLDRALGEYRRRATVSSIKGRVGEGLGVGGALSLVTGALSLARQEIVGSPTAGTGFGSERLQVVAGARAAAPEQLLISSTDVDGSCVTLAMRPVTPA